MTRETAWHWWHVEDGVAVAYPDTPETCRLIDTPGSGAWYASIEAAIRHGGVVAVAFKRRAVQVYDAAAWLATGDMVPAGEYIETKITAGKQWVTA